jgi:hypothetical protein
MKFYKLFFVKNTMHYWQTELIYHFMFMFQREFQTQNVIKISRTRSAAGMMDTPFLPTRYCINLAASVC